MPSDVPPGVDTAPPKKNGKKLGIIAGVGILIGAGVYLYARSKKSSTAVTSAGGANTIVLPSGTGDSTTASLASDLGPWFTQLSEQLSSLSSVAAQNSSGSQSNNPGYIPPLPPPVTFPNTPSAPADITPPYTPPTNEVLQGAGYWLPNSTAPIATASGQDYQYLSSWGAAQNIMNTGGTLYYQPAPGTFVPTGPIAAGGPLGSNTPLYIQESNFA